MAGDHFVPCKRASLLASIDDETVTQIVRGDGHAHAIAGKHADMVAAHAAAQLRANQRTALIDLHVVLTATEGVLNDALHFEKITFTHSAPCWPPPSSSMGPRTLARPSPGCN